MPPKNFLKQLESKLKLIKEVMGSRVLFSIGIRENNKIDILKAERICYCAKTPDDLVIEEENNPKENQIRSYVG